MESKRSFWALDTEQILFIPLLIFFILRGNRPLCFYRLDMTRNLLPLSALLILLLGFFGLLYQAPGLPARFPQPTDVPGEHREDEAFKEERKAFFEHMHKAAPGVDWRAMDRDTRKRKAIERFRHARAVSRSAEAFYQDTVANGQIVGHWREVGSNNQAGRTHLVDRDPQTGMLYLASAGGNIWKSPADGSDWQVLNDLFKIPDIILLRRVLTANGPRLLVASGAFGVDGFLYSDDEGLTWNWPTGLPGAQSSGRQIRGYVAPDSLQTVYLFFEASFSGTSALYKSENHGETFTQIATFPSLSFGISARQDIWLDAYGSGQLYFVANDRAYAVDSAGSLSLLGTIPDNPGGSVRFTGIETADSTVLYVSYVANNQSAIYGSGDGGFTWTYRGTAPTGQFSRRSFAASSVYPSHLYVGGVDAYRSHDGGQTWQLVNSWGEYYGNPAQKLHADIPGFNSFRDSTGAELLYVNTDGGTYVSTDSLLNVQNLSLSGLNVSQYYSVYTNRWNPNIIFAGSQDQGFQRADQDAGRTVQFEQTISGDYGHIVSQNGGNTVWTNYPGFTMVYPNAAFSTYNRTLDFPGSGSLWLAPLMEDPLTPTKVYFGGGGLNGGAHLFRIELSSDQLFAYEQPFDFSLGSGSSVSAMAYSPIQNQFRYVMTDVGDFFISGDGGNNWNHSSGFLAPQGQYFYGASIVASPAQLGKVYAAGSGYSNSPVYVSNNGTTFTPASDGLPATLVYDLAVTDDESLLFAATEVGPYVYVVAEDQWYPMDGISAPDQIYWSVEYIPALHTVRFGTYGRGIWDFVLCDATGPSPVAAFNPSVNTTFVAFQNTSESSYFYQWDFGDGTTANTRNASHEFDLPGTYAVRLIAQNFCGADTFEQVFSFGVTGIEPDLEQTAFRVYPNPTAGAFYLRNEGETQPALRLEVVSLTGSIVLQESLSVLHQGDLHTVSLPSIARGTYFVVLRDGEGKVLQRSRILLQ